LIGIARKVFDGKDGKRSEFDKSVRRPKFLTEFLTRYQLALSEQESEDLKGLVLELQADAVLVQLTGMQIEVKDAEAQPRTWCSGVL